MNIPNEGSGLPPAVLEKLHQIRNEDRRIRFGAGLLRALTVLLAAMLAAMLIDRLATVREEPLRWVLTLCALGCAAVAVVVFCLLPLLKKRPLSDIARDVDAANPGLEERYMTLAGFARSQETAELRGSDAMLRKVAQQASDMSRGIAPKAVISRSALFRAARQCAGMAAIVVILFAADFSRTRVLFQRFWAPAADITMTRLTVKPGDITVGKGDDVTLEADATGQAPASADLFIRSTNHNDTIALPRAASGVGKYTYAMNAVADSFEYRLRAGDGETAWHKVTVVDRPKISEVKLRVVAPAYSKLPVVDQSTLPRQLRALDGSEMEVSFKSDQPLASMELKFSNGKILPITESADHTYHFNATLTNAFGFTPVFTNLYHLDNLPKPTCEISVYKDQPPTVKIITPKDEITARPDDKVKIEFQAKDDFGVARAELVVTVKNETNSTTTIVPIPLGEQAGAKGVRQQVDLDLSKFDLKQDQELSYFVRVTDTKENPGLSSPDKSQSQPQNPNPETAQNNENPPQPGAQQTNAALAKAETPKPAGTNSANAARSDKSSQQAQQPKNSNSSSTASSKPSSTNAANLAQAKQPENNEAKKDSDKKQPQEDPAHQANKIHLAANAPPPKPKSPQDNEGDNPPPNNMMKRVLDVAQSCDCQPMKIKVDQWGRSFEGQMRDKLEIAIDPVLKKLDELLGKAQESAEATLSTGRSTGSLGKEQTPAMESARENLRQSDAAVTELKKTCNNTPYAFISLQLDDIRNAQIAAARKDLGNVTLDSAAFSQDVTNLERGSFEIKTAREKLANLTKTYESVKRDNKLADAMQRLAKMHQIFLEDTQAMLGSSKPILNPQQRKVAEVSDEFADKLKKLLEEKKKIMAELAKILANDPRLLRRFMAMEQLEGTTLRDQMTLLAQRQQDLAREGGQWAAAATTDHPALIKAMMTTQSSEQNEVSGMTAKLLENMVTWAPMDIPADREPLAGCRNIAGEAARLAADAARQAAPETMDASLVSASNSLEQLRKLQAALPGLDWVTDSKEKVSAFEANRLNDTAELITRQSGWIKKMLAMRSGDYAQVAEVDEHRLMLDTTTLSEKLDATATSVGNLSLQIKAKADQLNDTMHDQILPDESNAADALSRKTVPEAAGHQVEATNAFARGEKQFDELLKLIIDKLDAEPPPTEAGQAPGLDKLLADLQEEQKACEKLGIPCRPINVQVSKDWTKPGSCENPGGAQAQARAAQEQARDAKQKAEQMQEKAKLMAQERVEALPPTTAHKEPDKIGPHRPTGSWNTLASQLGDELRQGRDNVPPEQYRQAIEQYFTTISEKSGGTEAPSATK